METFNSYDVHIQFTYELEVDNKLPFLDMLLIRQSNQKVTTQWYQKTIASGRFLNYHSYHPLSQKLNMAKNLAMRVNKLTTDLDDQAKIKIIDDQLKINDYPKSLRHRIANRMNENTIDDNNTQQQQQENLEYTYRSIPFIPHLSNRIDRVLKQDYANIRLAKYNVKTVKDMFTKIKDPVPPDHQTHVVYIIPCNNCEAAYVGMTTNRLKTRMSGHQSHYNTMDRLLEQGVNIADPQITTLGERTALMNHSITQQHRFDLKKVKVLDRNNNTHKLQFLEMCHITNNSNSINRRTDTEGLHAIYAGILHEMRRMHKTRNRNEHENEENVNTLGTHAHNNTRSSNDRSPTQ